jgi:GNAT superfamily N-acetyltransferase
MMVQKVRPGNFETSERALLALKHRLYVNGWRMYGSLMSASLYPELYWIELHYEDGVPVAALLTRHMISARRKYKRLTIQLFVRKKHRRCGIGTSLINRITDERVKVAGIGIRNSNHFWRKMDVRPLFCRGNEPKELWNYSL